MDVVGARMRSGECFIPEVLLSVRTMQGALDFAAGACLGLLPGDPIAVCALDTDGTDGPTMLAGALTDGTTVRRAAERGMHIYESIVGHDVSQALVAVEDAVVTRPTGTNVNDLVVVVVLPAQD
jgi:hydroxypyruvate reductase